MKYLGYGTVDEPLCACDRAKDGRCLLTGDEIVELAEAKIAKLFDLQRIVGTLRNIATELDGMQGEMEKQRP